MSLRLEVKKLMLERSPRVKAIDFHPVNPWVVFGLYSGTLSLYDYSNNVKVILKNRLAFAHYKHQLFRFVQ
jgi:coatomer subunit beta'